MGVDDVCASKMRVWRAAAILLLVVPSMGFQVRPSNHILQKKCQIFDPRPRAHQSPANSQQQTKIYSIELESLMDMDVVIYKEADAKKLGAVQEDGTLLPLSAWSQEPAFGNSIECLVDEEDRVPGGISMEGVTIESIIPEEKLSYGSRQVGGGKGPGNPHGEESELLYYVDKDIINDGIQVALKPDLEILW